MELRIQLSIWASNFAVHPIANIGPTREVNIIDKIPFFRHPVSWFVHQLNQSLMFSISQCSMAVRMHHQLRSLFVFDPKNRKIINFILVIKVEKGYINHV